MQTKMTPLMHQYWEIKAQHEDKVVLFRMGDFFEMFHQDAEIAAPILGIALTQRNKKDSESPKMCGVPHHSIATPIAKLLTAGHKVAICDQIEDPAVAKGIVKRAVTRILTPGMVYDPDTLDQLSANYLCAYDSGQIAFTEVTTGEAFYYEYAEPLEREELLNLLSPVELVLSDSEVLTRKRDGYKTGALISNHNVGEDACKRLLSYLESLQGDKSTYINSFELRRRRAHMRLSETVIRHLEIVENNRGGREGTLFSAINRTRTSSGARLLKKWLLEPLLDVEELSRRYAELERWISCPTELKEFRVIMGQLGDVERRLGKVHNPNFNARDLWAIGESVLNGQALCGLHPEGKGLAGLDEAVYLAQQVLNSLQPELPIGVREGGIIKSGVVPELDELITLTQNSQKLMLELEAREKQSTQISSLKVRYNNVFGFYIEITKTHAHKAPAHYRRKQTLTNAERYTTDELDGLEEKILSAKAKRDQLEFEIFSDLRNKVEKLSPVLLSLARGWTRWDVISALAWLALERSYRRPRFSVDGELKLELCRHPVVEQTLGSGFVPNSISLKKGECLLLTGPNMAGKSTLMRQVALIAILAQIGSFVPAEHATLPLFDEVFTRIGASDSLNDGLSTFMVEMTETAAILKRVSETSLVIMDEIGRGTSTYDGLSLAQAILEYLVTEKEPYLLFATHYHELTQLPALFPKIYNGHMSVFEKSGQIQFLHSLVKGPANRSYGVQVAKLAGIPAAVTKRAQSILSSFEGESTCQLSLMGAPHQSVSPESSSTTALLEEVKNLDVSRMTPLEALNKLSEWQREASS